MKALKNTKKLQQNFLKNQKAGIFSSIKGQIDKILEVSPYDKNPAILDSNLAMYSEMRQFKAFLTKNAFDMSMFNEYDVWPHTNFGTIDNPLLIFGAGTTWRMVVCSGPGSEEESSSHEKKYMIVREGPIHRCLICGQCFKLVKLKDSVVSEENLYYSSVFTQISERVVGDLEDLPLFTYNFTSSDTRDWRTNIIPRNRLYAFVNADKADHIMVDPAYRMEFYKNLETDYYKKTRVCSEIERQSAIAGIDKEQRTPIDKDVYQIWFNIEKDILKFDRIYNRYEKFTGRALFDPENHERRERRMLERKSERENENYTIYQGGLNEEEQCYRDYYESDLEEYPDDNYFNNNNDIVTIANRREFDMRKYDFLEENTNELRRAPADSFVEKMIFKHKYRQISDPDYERRCDRVNERAIIRTDRRDPLIVGDLGDKIEEIYVRKGLNENITGTEDELVPYAGYIAEEGYAQFVDYYESDIENGQINRELLEDLSERDRISFSECYFNELNKSLITDKQYIMIPKRPFDNNKSVVHNFVEDLKDFNYRIKPLTRTLVFRDVSAKYQILPLSAKEAEIVEQDNERYKPILQFKKTAGFVSKKVSSDDIPKLH
jgi:hypothetical protein